MKTRIIQLKNDRLAQESSVLLFRRTMSSEINPSLNLPPELLLLRVLIVEDDPM
ncbi:MAG: hypothetical protein WA828_01800 [Coleofasciculaceae cyanobacterium]